MLPVLFTFITIESAFAAPQNLQVQVNGNLIAINADNVMVKDLLAELAKHTGMKVVSNVPLDQTISIDLDPRTLPKVLSRILKDKNTILQSNTNGDSQEYILWVIADVNPKRMAAVPSPRFSKRLNSTQSCANSPSMVHCICPSAE